MPRSVGAFGECPDFAHDARRFGAHGALAQTRHGFGLAVENALQHRTGRNARLAAQPDAPLGICESRGDTGHEVGRASENDAEATTGQVLTVGDDRITHVPSGLVVGFARDIQWVRIRVPSAADRMEIDEASLLLQYKYSHGKPIRIEHG